MLLHDARREARFDAGEIVLLEDQDHRRWDGEQILAGRATLQRALALGGHGPYVLQAAIASLHTSDPRDWRQIASLYGELSALTGSPVVELGRAVAVAEVEGPLSGLEILNAIDGLAGYSYLHATRGELLRRLGRAQEAREAVAEALRVTNDDAERRLLRRRLAELDAVRR